jgi:hypothetical protein
MRLMFSKTAVTHLVAATIAATALLPVPYGRAATRFDGAWSVVVLTTSGRCDPSYRFSGQIVNGEISYAYGSIEVKGSVVSSGAVFVRVSGSSGHAEAHGHFTVVQGSGTWHGEGPDGHCAGTWSATRSPS